MLCNYCNNIRQATCTYRRNVFPIGVNGLLVEVPQLIAQKEVQTTANTAIKAFTRQFSSVQQASLSADHFDHHFILTITYNSLDVKSICCLDSQVLLEGSGQTGSASRWWSMPCHILHRVGRYCRTHILLTGQDGHLQRRTHKHWMPSGTS